MPRQAPHLQRYPLGKSQWRILYFLLSDGGQFSTRELTETLFPEMKREQVRRKLIALAERGLLDKELSGKVSLWAIRVAREPNGWTPE